MIDHSVRVVFVALDSLAGTLFAGHEIVHPVLFWY
jgi:hypothetical protein